MNLSQIANALDGGLLGKAIEIADQGGEE